MNWKKQEELRQAKQKQGDHSPQQNGQKPIPGQHSQQPGQSRQQADHSGTQEAFRPTDTD
jgi:hypothetical protein